VPADPVDVHSAPAQRLDEACRVALQRRHEPRGEADRKHRAPREAGGLKQAVEVEQERVRGEGEADGCEPQRLDPRRDQLLAGHVQVADHGDLRAFPDDVRSDVRDERAEHEHRGSRHQGSGQVDPAAPARGGQTRREQDDGDRGDRQATLRDQRDGGERGEEGGCRNGAHGT
jgi:hypothetical protein